MARCEGPLLELSHDVFFNVLELHGGRQSNAEQ